MKKYYYRTFIATVNIIFILIIEITSVWFLVSYMNSFYLKYGSSFMIICIGIYSVLIIINYCKKPLLIDETNLITYMQLKKEKICFSEVKSISYKGFYHFIFADVLFICCNDGKIIGIEASYENYYELWSQIILFSGQANPNVVILDNLKKRMARGK